MNKGGLVENTNQTQERRERTYMGLTCWEVDFVKLASRGVSGPHPHIATGTNLVEATRGKPCAKGLTKRGKLSSRACTLKTVPKRY